MLLDGLMAIALLALASGVRFGADWSAYWGTKVEDPELLVFAYAGVWVGVLALNGLYRPRAHWTIQAEAVDLLRATAMMAAILLGFLFWIRLDDISRLFLLLLFPAQWLIALSTRVALRVLFRRLRSRGYNRRFMVVLGSGPRGQAFAARIESHRELGLEIAGFLDDDPSIEIPPRWRYLGTLDQIENVISTQVVDEVAICLPFSQWHRTHGITRVCEDQGKIVRVPVDFLDRAFASAKVEDLDGLPVYSLVSGPDRLVGLTLKRWIDLFVAAVGLVLLSPVFLVIAALIRHSDGSPILFRQVRIGLHGRPFEVIKFRTMTRDAEDRYHEVARLAGSRGPAFKMDGDPRITKTGHFLRRTSLDELPQLWNVLRGEMSLVGPRPAPPREVDDYDLWHRRRLSMKPGITGLWQVTARRSNDFDQRAELDLAYIDRWSLGLDFKILARTIPAAFDGR